MAEFDNIALDRVGTDGRVARVTLNRPEKMNALSFDLISELNEALHDLEADDSVRVIIIKGAGRTFSAGYDLSMGQRSRRSDSRAYRTTDEQGRHLVMNMRTSLQQVTDVQMYFWNMAKVTVAQVHGYCLAGGCELAMMADLITAAEDAQFGHPGHRGLGVARNGVIWPLVIGMRKAKELSYTGDSISGVEAERIGMINYAFPAQELEARTIQFADRIANMSSDHLAILKCNANRFYENMGIYSSVRSSSDHDAAAQFTAQAYALRDRMYAAIESGGGLKEVFDWRDKPYEDYRGTRL